MINHGQKKSFFSVSHSRSNNQYFKYKQISLDILSFLSYLICERRNPAAAAAVYPESSTDKSASDQRKSTVDN